MDFAVVLESAQVMGPVPAHPAMAQDRPVPASACLQAASAC